MDRIICDICWKTEKALYGDDPNSPFNLRITSVNEMYRWLYNAGILQKTAFEFHDLPDCVVFALDAKALKPYREAMERSGVKGADLAAHHIFDEAYTPCMYSGAIELGWFMSTYRDVDGCVGRSWECGLVQGLNLQAISEIQKAKTEQGVTAAVNKMFSFYHWPEQEKKPDLHSVIQSAEGETTAACKPEALVPGRAAKDVLCNDR